MHPYLIAIKFIAFNFKLHVGLEIMKIKFKMNHIKMLWYVCNTYSLTQNVFKRTISLCIEPPDLYGFLMSVCFTFV